MVDAFLACLRSCSHTHAVELLEQGRGIFWNQLTRLRFPLDEVIAWPCRKEVSTVLRHMARLRSPAGVRGV